MNTNTSKERSFYTQGQQFAARILCIVWLLASGSPEGVLAAPKRQMVPATKTSPGDPFLASTPSTPPPGGILQLPPDSPGSFWGDSVANTPAIERVLQQRMSQEAVPFRERDLLRTSPKVTPVEGSLPFQARGGESVRFACQMGHWRAEVFSSIGACSWLAVLPVVCGLGRNVGGKLRALQRCSSWYIQQRIHMLSGQQVSYVRELVYGGASRWEGDTSHLSSNDEPIKQAPTQFLSNSQATGRSANAAGFLYTGRVYFPAKEKSSYDTRHASKVSSPKTSSRLLFFGSQVLGLLLLTPRASNQEESDSLSIADRLEALALDPQIDQQPHPATRTSDFGLARRDQSAENKGPTPLELAQIEAKKLKEQIDQRYPKLSEATDEADAQQLVEELITPLERLVELEGFWSEDSLGQACAQDYLVKLWNSAKSRELALDQARDQQLIRLLERSYSGSLKQLVSATESSQKVQLIKALEKLAALASDQGAMTQDLSLYTDAAILYQHILSICAKEQDTLDSEAAAALQNAAYQGLAQLQATMLAQAKGVEATPPEEVASLQKRISEDRSELEAFRADVKPRTTALINNLEAALIDQDSSDETIKQAEEAYIQGSQALFGKIAQWMGELLAKFYQESEALLGPAPCKYAVMGLGSMALQQITPYSDLEFAILMENAPDEDTAEAWRAYFRKLTHLVHLRVINLGETVVPFSKYKLSLDHLGKRGLNFDLGGKTPLVRKDKLHLEEPYELIQPVSAMVHYLHNEEDKMEHMDKLLPYILESTCYVYGDSSLHERYVAAKCAFLLESKDESGNPAYQKRALKKLVEGVVEMDYKNPEQYKNLEGDLADFEPQFELTDEGKLYNVKQEIYRLPDRLLYRLAMYYGILPESGWDAVDQLSQQDIIGVGENAQQAAHHLQYAVSFATMLRLQTYLYHGQQKEDLTILGECISDQAKQEAVRKAFLLPQEALGANGSLFRYYYTAFPLHDKMQTFFGQAKEHKFSPTEKTSFFQRETFYDDNAEIKASIHQRLLQYKEATACLEQVLSINKKQYSSEHSEVARILINLGIAYENSGQYAEAQERLEEAHQIQKHRYSADHSGRIRVLVNLGVVYWDLGQYDKAQECYKKALPIIRKHYGEDHPKAASTLMNLGVVYWDLGQYDKAQECYKKAHEIQEQHYGSEHPEVAFTLVNLGNVYYSLGKYDEVQKCLENALKIQVSHYESAHPKTAKTLVNLGNIYYSLGQYANAKTRLEEALGIKERHYGPGHPETAKARLSLGNVYTSLGLYVKAQNRYEEALKIQEQHYRADHPEVARPLTNLGVVYYRLGRYNEAETCYKKALKIQEQHYGSKNPEVAEILVNLGNFHKILGQYDEARDCLAKALKIQKQHYEADHPEVARPLMNLGNVYQDLGQYDEAKSSYEKTYEIQKRYYRADHPELAETLMNLGVIYLILSQYAKAESHLAKALSVLKQHYGEHHPNVTKTLMHLGKAYQGLGQHEQALGQHEQALDYYQKALQMQKALHEGENHDEVATALRTVGIAYHNLGNYTEALEYFKQVLQMQQALHEGENHAQVAQALNLVGAAYQNLGNYTEALEYFKQVLQMQQALHEGENHAQVAQALNLVGAACHNLGNYTEALEYFKQILQMQQALHEGENHAQVAQALNLVGAAYHNLGNYTEALEYFKQVLQMQQALHEGENHAQVAAALRTVGIAYERLSNYTEALEYYQQALTMYQALHEGENHNEVAQAFYAVGVAYGGLGRLEESIQSYEQALAVPAVSQAMKASTGHNLGCMYHIASLAARQKDDEQCSQAYLEKASTSFEQAIQANDAVEADLYTEYGNFLLDTGKAAQAHNYLQQAIESGDNESELGYGFLEQPAVKPVLQAYISQQQEVSLRGIDYAYYLMIHHYEDFQKAGIAMDKTREAYLAAYQASLHQRSGQPGQAQEDKTAYHLLGSLYEAQGDQEAAAAAFAHTQDGAEQEDTQAAA